MLTPAMEIAAAELATGKSIEEVSGELGRHRTTLTRWKKVPAFKEAIAHAQKDIRDRILKKSVAA